MLVDNDLQAIAAPRVGRVRILARNTDAFYQYCQGRPLVLFANGGQVFGATFGTIMSWPPSEVVPQPIPGDSLVPVAMSIDVLLAQKVLALDGKWACRRDVIKYIANSKSGVHSASDDPDIHPLLSRLELSASYQFNGPGGVAMMTFHNTEKLPPVVSATYVRDALNPVLTEIFAAAVLLASAPDILTLEGVLKQEFA